MIVADQSPIRAAVVATVEPAFLGYDERINDIGIGSRNGYADPAERPLGHAIAFDALPCCAIVARTVDTTLVAAAVERPRSAGAFPHRSKKNVGIVGIEDHVNRAGAIVDI